MRLRVLLVGLSFTSLCFAQAPDTIRVMHYNLLNYRNTTAQCTESTNNADTKDANLAKIVSHAKPDVITINEMGAHWLNPNKIISNALNVNGIAHFDQAEFTNNTFSSLTNMLFYNSDKLVMYGQELISKDKAGDDLVRVIDIYTLYIKDARALNLGDTTFMTFIVTHLKAGSTTDDKNQRALMTEAVMSYLKKSKKNHAYFMNGDFNVQSSSETSYKNLIEDGDESIRFYDPIDASGSWNNNSSYANVHTQSTHISDTRGGCFSSGGLDDRFDFILFGKEVIDQRYRVKYITGSYEALGQDSKRFNGEVSSPLNTKVPHTVALALYEMSDHLPVILDVEVQRKSASVQPFTHNSRLIVRNTAEGEMKFQFEPCEVASINLINANGVSVNIASNLGSISTFKTSRHDLAPGMYMVFIRSTNGSLVYSKFILK